eukprot:SAG31_NODE_1411_length_8466_cov_18.216565_4_plen_98_part_00
MFSDDNKDIVAYLKENCKDGDKQAQPSPGAADINGQSGRQKSGRTRTETDGAAETAAGQQTQGAADGDGGEGRVAGGEDGAAGGRVEQAVGPADYTD